MVRRRGKIYIGTSGWVYSHWQGVFYPEGLSSKDKLKYFAKHFKTTEVNYSFYHLPSPNTYQKWYKETPDDFLFSVKASRFITHIKRLKAVKRAWQVFLRNALELKEKLGPILFQFPPNFKATKENIRRLENFLKLISVNQFASLDSFVSKGASQRKSTTIRFAFEFRHQSWFTPLDNKHLTGCGEKTYKLLRKYKVAWVIADSPKYPRADVVTADFVYIRMHGSKAIFSSKYTKAELKGLAREVKKWQKQGLDIYCYFNNDAHGYAVENARTLLKFCS